MISNFDRFTKRRLISSYFSVVFSIFLVLFLLGALGLFVINSKRLADNFKEKIAMTVFFKHDTPDSTMVAFGEQLKKLESVRSYKFVSNEEAAAKHEKEIGEDFMEFLGMNPLQDSYDIHFKAEYVDNSSLSKIQQQMRESDDAISDIVYDKQLVSKLNDNIEKISMYILIISGFLAIVAVLLINSSMRLSIHSNRFIIKTMQMVGATKSFIRKPFIWRSIRLGIIGAILAVIALMGILFYLDTNYPDLEILFDPMMTGAVLLGVIVVGILITWFSTFIATQRFLNLRTDDLY